MNSLKTILGLAFAALPVLAVPQSGLRGRRCANRVDLDAGARAARPGWSC
jgi:hypothetical protein